MPRFVANLIPDALQGQLVAHGGKFAGGLLVFAGLLDVGASLVPDPPPRLGIAVHGLQAMCTGAALLLIAKSQKHSTDMIVQSEAEKRVSDPHLPSASSVPAIQKEIEKIQSGADSVPSKVEDAIDAKRQTGETGKP